MATFQEVIDWAASVTDRPAGQCQGFVGNDLYERFYGSFPRSYYSAQTAGDDSPLQANYPGEPSWAFFTSGADGHVAFGTPEYLIQDWRYVPNKLNGTGVIGWDTLAHMQAVGFGFRGWSRSNGSNPPLSFTDSGAYAPGTATGAAEAGYWVPGMTDYKGGYGEQSFQGAKFYVVEPVTDSSKTIAAVCDRYGISLSDAAAWTAAVRNSKYASIAGEGGGWWDGSDRYFAGNRFALNDIVSALDAFYAAQAAQDQADLAAGSAALAEQIRVQAELDKKTKPAVVQASAATAQATADQAALAAQRAQAAKEAYENAKSTAYSISADVQTTLMSSGEVKSSKAPFAGLFARFPKARFWTYIGFASLNLLANLAAGLVIFHRIPPEWVTEYTDWIGYGVWSLSLIGTAFGFVAAANVDTSDPKPKE